MMLFNKGNKGLIIKETLSVRTHLLYITFMKGISTISAVLEKIRRLFLKIRRGLFIAPITGA